MTKGSAKINIWLPYKDLDELNGFCKRKGYYRSTFIRIIMGICVEYDIEPEELLTLLNKEAGHS